MLFSRTLWRMRCGGREFLLKFACALPMSAGIRLRSKVLPLFLARLGKDTIVQDGLRITNPEKVSIGAHCNLAARVFITGGGGVTIGDYVGLGPDVKIWSVNHRYDDPDTPWLTQGYVKKPVVIEDDVWLGANCFVMPGLLIGKGAILSAGTVLMKSVPPFAIVAGNPGRVVGWRKRTSITASASSEPLSVSSDSNDRVDACFGA